MTLRSTQSYPKTVNLPPALHARWLAYHRETGQSFRGYVILYLEATLPLLGPNEKEAQP